MYDNDDLDKLRAMMPEYLERKLGIQNPARNFCCPSPEHEDKDPSAQYYDKDHRVHCFGCGRTWDVFRLAEDLDGIGNFKEQVKAVADVLGVDIRELPPDKGKAAGRKPGSLPRRKRGGAKSEEGPKRAERTQDCSRQCREAFGALFEPENDFALKALEGKGLGQAEIARFGIGFAANPKSIMPEFRVWEPKAEGFIVLPFWDEAFDRAPYCMLHVLGKTKPNEAEWRPSGMKAPLFNESLVAAGSEELTICEHVLDAIAVEAKTGERAVALGGQKSAMRLAKLMGEADPASRPGKVVLVMESSNRSWPVIDRIEADMMKLGIAVAHREPAEILENKIVTKAAVAAAVPNLKADMAEAKRLMALRPVNSVRESAKITR